MKRIALAFILFFCTCILFHFCYPVRIIGMHKASEYTVVLVVEHFPLTKKSKISWWESHKAGIFNALNFHSNDYTIYIYNTHYKKDSGTDQDSDLLCFEDMATEQNCISKENRPLIVWHYPDGHTEYETESLLRRFY